MQQPDFLGPSISNESGMEKRKRALELISNTKVSPDERTSINLQAYLVRFLKPKVQLSNVPEISQLGLILLNREVDNQWLLPALSMNLADVPYHLILMYHGAYRGECGIATVGFRVGLFNTIVFIDQIQGLNYEDAGRTDPRLRSAVENILVSFRWEKMIVIILLEWARCNGFETIGIKKACSNRWYKTEQQMETEDLSEERREWQRNLNKRLHIKYDVTAKKLKFKENPYFGDYWMKSLS